VRGCTRVHRARTCDATAAAAAAAAAALREALAPEDPGKRGHGQGPWSGARTPEKVFVSA